MKKLLSIALVGLFTITAANLYACGKDCGDKKNASAKIEKIQKYGCGSYDKSAKSSASAKVQPSPYVEANVISVSNDGAKQYRCPVSGIENTVATDTKFIDYESKRYYLNCPGSQAKFEANPSKYVLAMNGKTKIQYECTPDQCDHAGGNDCGDHGVKDASIKNPKKSS